jgi:hypothetical protein
VLLFAGASYANELCPVAQDRLNRSVNYNNRLITAPTTKAQTAAALEALKNGQGEARENAVVGLAMAGDLDAFHHLYTTRDTNGLFIYASRYLNSDGTVCLDASIEAAVLQELHSADLSRSLVGLLAYNTYRDKHILHALLEIPFQATPAQADKYLVYGRAMTSTHLPGIEPVVLAHARTLLNLDTPVKKRVLPGLHQHYVEFFAQRGYRPAVTYFNELLQVADREEPMQNFQIANSMLRGTVQRGLASLGGPESAAMLVADLHVIAQKLLDAFTAGELQTLSKQVLTTVQPGDTLAVVAAYERMLATEQLPHFHYPMRRTIYPTLASLNTPESSALLVAELEQFAGLEPLPNKDAVKVLLFSALEQTQTLDIESVVKLVSDELDVSDRRRIWHIATLHPGDASVKFLLAELTIANSGNVERLLGIDADKVLINHLVGFESPQLKRRIRKNIDDTFAAGTLGEPNYMQAALQLNKDLGDQSPRFTAFVAERDRRRAAEKKQEYEVALQQARRDSFVEYQTELARNSTRQGIANNISGLTGSTGKNNTAMQWLIIVGEAALPQLHAALDASGTSDAQRFRIINILGEIGHVSSVGPLISTAEKSVDGGLYRPALFALALMPPSDEAIAFALAQLKPGVSHRQQTAALVYLAQIRHASAGAQVISFAEANPSTQLKVAALYFRAHVGTPGTVAAIEAAMQTTTDRSELETLLVSLGEAVSTIEEFERIANQVGIDRRPYKYRQMHDYCKFRIASGQEKVDFAFKVFADNSVWQRREAVRFLVKTDPQGTMANMTTGMGQILPLHKLLSLSSGMQLLFTESRRMGLQLEQTLEGYVLVKP